MRQVHRGGEKLFVDYAGQRPPAVIETETGERKETELFVAVVGASSFTFAEASWTQQSQDWIASHMRAFEYLGGVPAAVVPDQLRTAVSAPCRYETGIQRTYQEFAEHYGTPEKRILPQNSSMEARAAIPQGAPTRAKLATCLTHWVQPGS